MRPPDHLLRFDADVYVTRARPSRAELLANDGYAGVQIIDCGTGRVARAIPFSADAAEDGGCCVHGWFVAPAGDWSLTVDSERRLALRVDHERGSVAAIPLPATQGLLTGLSWFEPDLQVLDHDGLTWTLSGDALRHAPPAEGLVQWMSRVKEHVEDFDHYNVLRTDHGSGQAYVLSRDSSLVGRVDLDSGRSELVPGGRKVIDVAGFGGRTWVCYERRVVGFTDGASETFFEPPEEEYLVGVNAVVHGEAAYLTLLSSLQDHSESRLRIYAFPR